MYQKTIKLFLLDGEANQRIIAELTNWNGIAYKIPKTKLKECKSRNDLQFTGVYLLFGENDGNPAVYIGEAECIYDRLVQHLNDDKDFWNVAITFVRKDNSLNKAHVKYLENVLYNIAKSTKRYEVMNNSIPTKSTLTEPEEAEMAEMIDDIKMITNVLGYKVFEDMISDKLNEKDYLYFKTKSFSAKAIMTEEGFVVLKGSSVSNSIAPTLAEGTKKLRKKLIEDGIIDDEKHILTQNYLFTSSSAGLATIYGTRISGPQNWKYKNGTTLKEKMEK